MFAPLCRRANAALGGMRAPVERSGGPRQPGPPLPAAALFGMALLVAWTFLFLGVHELQHIGQADASDCVFAPIAAVVGGSGVPPVPLTLVPPAAPVQTDLPAIASCPRAAVRFAPNARAPPLLA